MKWAATLLPLALTACIGALDGGARAGGAPSETDPLPPPITPLACVTPNVGPTPMRRLSHTEYDHAVRDLLGVESAPGRLFAPDTAVDLFESQSSAAGTVGELLAEQYLDTAVAIAEELEEPSSLTGCALAEEGCVGGFVERFGRLAYRRPLEMGEVDGYLALYDRVRTEAESDEDGVRAVLVAMLVSPHFLFRPELGVLAEGEVPAAAVLPVGRPVTGYEMATRLASLVWSSVPDEALLDAAENGELDSASEVAARARAMLDDDRGHETAERFLAEWLELDRLATITKDPSVYPELDEPTRAAMDEDAHRFIQHVLWESDARLETLFLSPRAYVDAHLAPIYGVAMPTGTEWMAIELDPSERAGVLTRAATLTILAAPASSSPTKRGTWVRERVLCHDLEEPPPGIPAAEPPTPGVSTRERFAMHSRGGCATCHHLIDGLGFGLEQYDGIGRFRTVDNGVAVDSTGEVGTTRDADGPYEGGAELAARLAESEQVRDCMATQWMRYAMARRETRADTCSLVNLRDAFAASDGDLRELVVAMTQTDAFWHHRDE